MDDHMNLGAVWTGSGLCRFRVWAPRAGSVQVHTVSPEKHFFDMQRDDLGFFSTSVEGIHPGTEYFFRLDGKLDRPDPASYFQPHGVHGASRIIDLSFPWEDEGWTGVPLHATLFYELHVGTFTPEGTFDAIIPRIPILRDLGINNIEIMPVAQFPGERNWGYDGVYLYSVQNSYGGPEAFMRFVNACHKHGIAVTLDVVYNHLGPEGNYLRDFGPYFTSRYRTPWGDAVNFDGPWSDGVRDFFIGNALHWFKNFHVDALRLDAVHAMTDMSATPFLRELSEKVEVLGCTDGRKRYLIAESDLNDSRLIRPRAVWGFGLDAQWCDDFHHSLHAVLTGETEGYYADFGSLEHLEKAFRDGFVYSGGYSVFRQRRHGNFSADLPSEQFVVASQNHDQVGIRMLGERLSALVSFEARKLAAGVVLLSPFIPLLFMGEEYNEDAPFLYFISHGDPDLVDAVRKGRREEFQRFEWTEDPPDPQAEETFLKSRIGWHRRNQGLHKVMLDFYRRLICLRQKILAVFSPNRKDLQAKGIEDQELLILSRENGTDSVLCLFHFGKADTAVQLPWPVPSTGKHSKVLDSADVAWSGPGSRAPVELGRDDTLFLRAESFLVYTNIDFCSE